MENAHALTQAIKQDATEAAKQQSRSCPTKRNNESVVAPCMSTSSSGPALKQQHSTGRPLISITIKFGNESKNIFMTNNYDINDGESPNNHELARKTRLHFVVTLTDDKLER